jgi:hypothetical protein
VTELASGLVLVPLRDTRRSYFDWPALPTKRCGPMGVAIDWSDFTTLMGRAWESYDVKVLSCGAFGELLGSFWGAFGELGGNVM